MRELAIKWAITLTIFFGVPVAFVWIFMPYLDMSHATYLAAQGDYALAIRALNRAIRFNPGLAEAYSRRSWVEIQLGEFDKAVADCNRSIAINDAQWEAFNNRAWAEMSAGADLKKARQDADQAVALCPSCPQAYDTRGMIEMKQNQTDRALEDFNRAVGMDEKFSQAYLHRAEAYDVLNEPDKAKSDRKHAQQLNSGINVLGVLRGGLRRLVAFAAEDVSLK